MLARLRPGRCLLILLANIWGCATWTETNQESPELPKPRMFPDSVVLDITFVRVPPERNSDVEAVWNEIDETRIPPELRRDLGDNGMRCGLVGQRLPDGLRQWLDQRAMFATNPTQTVAWQAEKPPPWHHMQIRAGHRGEIVASNVTDHLIVLTKDQDGVGGKPYENAQCVFAIKSFPQGDGRARIELTPEIHHGEPRRDWKGDTGMWRNAISRPHRVFETLRLEAILSPGESLAMTCTEPSRGVGKHFFTSPGGAGQTTQKILLVRLAQTQYDELFSH